MHKCHTYASSSQDTVALAILSFLQSRSVVFPSCWVAAQTLLSYICTQYSDKRCSNQRVSLWTCSLLCCYVFYSAQRLEETVLPKGDDRNPLLLLLPLLLSLWRRQPGMWRQFNHLFKLSVLSVKSERQIQRRLFKCNHSCHARQQHGFFWLTLPLVRVAQCCSAGDGDRVRLATVTITVVSWWGRRGRSH